MRPESTPTKCAKQARGRQAGRSSTIPNTIVLCPCLSAQVLLTYQRYLVNLPAMHIQPTDGSLSAGREAVMLVQSTARKLSMLLQESEPSHPGSLSRLGDPVSRARDTFQALCYGLLETPTFSVLPCSSML